MPGARIAWRRRRLGISDPGIKFGNRDLKEGGVRERKRVEME
jgi:hypothetical protein